MTRTRITGAALLALALIALLPGIALAQSVTPAAATTGIDLTGIVGGVIIPLVQQIIIAAVTVGIAWLLRHLVGLNLDDRAKAAVTAAVENGVKLLAVRVTPAAGTLTVSTHNQMVDAVLTYVASRVPDALSRLGYSDPADIRAYVEARVAAWMGDSSLILETPSVPPTPATAPAASTVPGVVSGEAAALLDRLSTLLSGQPTATGTTPASPAAPAAATPQAA